MDERQSNILSDLVPDSELFDQIERLTGKRPSVPTVRRWRALGLLPPRISINRTNFSSRRELASCKLLTKGVSATAA